MINLFTKLANFESLTPLSGKDEEWFEYSDDCYQNTRYSAVFKEKETAYNIDGYVFYHDIEIENEDGHIEKNISSFTSALSKKQITFPYTIQKSEPVKVICYEVNDKNEKEKGTGLWETKYPLWIVEEHKKLCKLLNVKFKEEDILILTPEEENQLKHEHNVSFKGL